MKKEEKKVKKEQVKQLSLGLKSPFTNIFYNFKSRIVSRLNLFGANAFINDPIIWLLVSFQIVGGFYQMIYILNEIEKLPSVIPLFGYAGNNIDTLIPKFYYLLFPIISFILLVVGFRMAKSVYFKNNTLAHYTLFVGLLVSLSLTLHIIAIISQYV